MQVDVRTNEAPLAGGILVAIMALKLSEELLEHLRAIHGPRAEDEAHEARICGKRLRYHVEPFRAQVGEARGVVRLCKELQDVLGDMNDARVLRAWIEEHRGAAPEGATDGIAWVLERIATRHAGLHAELELDWLADGGARLADAVAAFDHRMAVELAPAQEIERKYLLRGAPALPPDAQRVDIEQGYLPAEGFEDRLRRKATADGATYLRTLKVGAGLARFESEQEVDEATFEALWPLTEGRRVHKRRHTVQGGGHLWEIDEFLDRDLWLAEVELASTDEEAVMPAWLASAVARDVTDSGEFGNRGLAR